MAGIGDAKESITGEVNRSSSTVSLPLTSTKQNPPIFNTSNSISDGTNRLRRIEFEFQGNSYKFALNPEEYNQTEVNRVTITQTKAGGWVDDFGGGVPTIAFKGTTGFKNGTKDGSNGFLKFKELRDMIRRVYFSHSPGTEVTTDLELIFHNYTDGEHWVVTPKQFALMKSVARPLMYMYDIQLICIRPADVPALRDTTLVTPITKLTDSNPDLFPKSSESFVRDNISQLMSTDVKNSAVNLSSLVGDDDGFISKTMTKFITSNLKVMSPGIVTLGENAELSDDNPMKSSVGEYISKVSPEAYSMYQLFLNSDPSIVKSTSSASMDSPLLSLSKSQPPLVKAMASALYTELVSAYNQTLTADPNTGFKDSVKADLSKTDNNIRWLCAKLEEQSPKPYELIEVVRESQKVISFLNSQPNLFGSTYNNKLSEFSKVANGGE